MKKLTLNQINLTTVNENADAGCDFCGEWNTGGIKSPFPVNYDKKEKETSYFAIICFDCIKQLNALITE